MERVTLKVGAAIEDILGEMRSQVQPIASMLQKIQYLGERLEEVESRLRPRKLRWSPRPVG
ncbi:hypothetical protein chiPu_0031954, partial [Chiloscyllium punctatum]|nr:hypothetical protein [Chiloscyllium punctatum]